MIKAPHIVACPIIFFFCDEGQHSGLLTLENQSFLSIFRPLWSISTRFWAGPEADYAVFDKNQESAFYNFVSNTFSFLLGSKATGRSA